MNNINKLQGPILVLGASGFVGANLLKILLEHRNDVYGVFRSEPAWRLEGITQDHLIKSDLLIDSHLKEVLDNIKPQTIFNCIAYGAYSFEKNSDLIYRTNLNLTVRILEELKNRQISCYVHSGSSSEYGDNAAGPVEGSSLIPNSHYSVSKISASKALLYYGQKHGLHCANLRLYSLYGPYEDSSRLIPMIVSKGMENDLPSFVDPNVSRDFVYIKDACEAFILCALNLPVACRGESFNIGTGKATTIEDVAKISCAIFDLTKTPEFTMSKREWDVDSWYADTTKSKEIIKWEAQTSFSNGLKQTIEWYKNLEDTERYQQFSKKYGLDAKRSVSAIVACYKDSQAIPIMYQRLTDVFVALKLEYEIIFVNDNSPDDSESVIQEISSRDHRVFGISHSRNFGSQSAFRSGMMLSTKNSCVLLDGDLQDPPELIEAFVAKWKEGADVVYGRRVKREAPFYMRFCYKFFYKIFDAFSYIEIPHDAGDFSLMDRKVIRSLLQFPERDLFLRGLRAYAGYRQIGVDYIRPERMFGVTTNSLVKNVNWAKKAIFSFSTTPLNILSMCGFVLFSITVFFIIAQIIFKCFWPEMTPKGVTTNLLMVAFFGSINLLALSVLGEYLGKVIEEVKRRPHFIRRSIIRGGEIRESSENNET